MGIMDNVGTREACLAACQAAGGCNALSYWAGNARCYLKQVSEYTVSSNLPGHEARRLCEPGVLPG